MEDEELSRAIELAIQSDFSGARARLAGQNSTVAHKLGRLLTLIEERERERKAAIKKARHEMSNNLSIARSSVEAMLDGIVGITNPRLNRIREILASVSETMYALTADETEEPFDATR